MKKFAQLGLNATLQENLKNINYIEPTDIQNKSIGAVLSRADTYAIAPTGTGKTAAYLLPVLQELSQSSFEKEDVRRREGETIRSNTNLLLRKYTAGSCGCNQQSRGSLPSAKCGAAFSGGPAIAGIPEHATSGS